MKIKGLFTAVCTLIAAVCCAASLSACSGGEIDANLQKSEQKLVVITVNATNEQKSFADALSYFKEQGKLEYEISDGFISSVNGYVPSADANEFWAIYTSLGTYGDVVYSNAEWGVYQYDGKAYASATFGADGLPLIKGETYILAVSTWSAWE